MAVSPWHRGPCCRSLPLLRPWDGSPRWSPVQHLDLGCMLNTFLWCRLHTQCLLHTDLAPGTRALAFLRLPGKHASGGALLYVRFHASLAGTCVLRCAADQTSKAAWGHGMRRAKLGKPQLHP